MLSLSGQSCSADSDCPTTTCVGDDYYVDTDGTGDCVYNEEDGQYECGGYDKVYSNADYCGGRYNYLCDSSGCESYKAACEADCSNNMNCDTYSFCSDNTDSGSTSPSCTDACQDGLQQCSGDTVVECKDTDSDSCTDSFVEIEACDGSCENAVCTMPQVTRWFPDETGESCVATKVDEGTSDSFASESACLDSLTTGSGDSENPDQPDRSLGERLDAIVINTLSTVWTTVTSLFS